MVGFENVDFSLYNVGFQNINGVFYKETMYGRFAGTIAKPRWPMTR